MAGVPNTPQLHISVGVERVWGAWENGEGRRVKGWGEGRKEGRRYRKGKWRRKRERGRTAGDNNLRGEGDRMERRETEGGEMGEETHLFQHSPIHNSVVLYIAGI